MTTQNTSLEPDDLFVKAERAEEEGDLKSSNGFLLEAAKLGHTGAQVALGNNYSSGQGITRSLEKAAYWYRRAYEAGDESGALNLAMDKLSAGKRRAAIIWLKRAIELHSGEAALELARLYSETRGGKAKAVKLLEATRRMRPAEISQQAKEDAATLLAELTRKTG